MYNIIVYYCVIVSLYNMYVYIKAYEISLFPCWESRLYASLDFHGFEEQHHPFAFAAAIYPNISEEGDGSERVTVSSKQSSHCA